MAGRAFPTSLRPEDVRGALAAHTRFVIGDLPAMRTTLDFALARFFERCAWTGMLDGTNCFFSLRDLDRRNRSGLLLLAFPDEVNSGDVAQATSVVAKHLSDEFRLRSLQLWDPVDALSSISDSNVRSAGRRLHRCHPNGMAVYQLLVEDGVGATDAEVKRVERDMVLEGAATERQPEWLGRPHVFSTSRLVAVPAEIADSVIVRRMELAAGRTRSHRHDGWIVGPPQFESGFWSAESQLLVVDRSDGSLIGTLSGYGPDFEVGEAFIAVVAHPTYRSSGLLLEAVPELVDHLFHTQPIDYVSVQATSNSIRTFDSASRRGFTEAVRLRRSIYEAGHWADEILLTVERHTWRSHIRSDLGTLRRRDEASPVRRNGAAPQTESVVEGVLSAAMCESVDDPLHDSIARVGCAVFCEELLGRPIADDVVISWRTAEDVVRFVEELAGRDGQSFGMDEASRA